MSLPRPGGGFSPSWSGQLRSASRMLVRTHPGHSTLTPIGSSAPCMLVYRSSDIATTACFDASYTAPNPGSSPAMLAVLTKCPPSGCSAIVGRNARTPCTTPQKFTPITQVQVDSGPNHASPLDMTPALLQTTCTAAKRSVVAAASACTD